MGERGLAPQAARRRGRHRGGDSGAARARAAPGLHDSSARAQAVHAGHKVNDASGHLGAVGKVDPTANGFDPQEILRDFDTGTLRERGVREWEIVAEDHEIEVAPGVKYAAWTYNGRVPGPTLRAREGERLRVRFVNGSVAPAHDALPRHPPRPQRRHPRRRPGQHRSPGESTTYEFDADAVRLHLYHCHSTPLAEHIAKGLYGAFIIDPKEAAREPPTSS